MEYKKVAFHTLGCKLNFAESATMERYFVENGYESVKDTEKADIYVINTCSVTDTADKKCRNIIRRFNTKNPEAIIVVTGCYAQLKAEEIAEIPGVDFVIGSEHKSSILEIIGKNAVKGVAKIQSCEVDEITSFFSSFSTKERTRSFLKVQDGCDYKCTYCTIPKARGKSRNASIESIVENAKEVASNGCKEIILTGVNIGDFGKSTGENFIDLIKKLDGVEGIERYRISSIEPNLLTEEVLDFADKSEKFQPYYHIPLQSGSNRVLSDMKRRYNREFYQSKIESIIAKNPKSFIGIDLIVGFPTETEEMFMESYEFLKELSPAFIHIFPYSKRAGTPAVEMLNVVTDADMKSRVDRLTTLNQKIARDFYKKNIGSERKVLFETRRKSGLMLGYTDNYIQVGVPYNKDLVNQIVKVKLEDYDETENIFRG